MMTMENEDAVRSMLRRHADDVTPSPDAWEQIQAKIADDERPAAVVRRHPFRVMAGGAAAAAVAALVVGQVLPSPTSQVAVDTPTTEAPATTAVSPGYTADVPTTPWVWPAADADLPALYDPVGAATAYLQDRTGAVAEGGEVTFETDRAATVLFLDGPVVSEVFLEKAGNRWFVDGAASDLIPLHQLTYTGRMITAEAVAESDGSVTLRYGAADGNPVVEDPVGPVVFRQTIALEQEMPGEDWVTAGAVLQTADGTFAVSESWQRNPDASAVPDTAPEGDDTYTGVYPAYTGEELAGYDDAARTDGDTTYATPASTAGAFLGDVLFPRGTSDVSYEVGEFRQGDALSGEVEFTLSDGGRGVVVVRKASAEARIWYVVTAFTEPALAVDVRVEGGGVTVEPATGATVEVAELQPLPGGELVTAEPADHLLRFEDVTNGIVRLVGTDADGRTAFLFGRVSPAG